MKSFKYYALCIAALISLSATETLAYDTFSHEPAI